MARRPAAGRRPMVAGNWKMHLTHLEAIAHTQRIAFSLRPAQTDSVDVVLLPPFTALRSVQTLIDGDRLPLTYGAQDLALERAGAHTGDVSGPMLAALGCSYVVVGHSERRAEHGESDALVAGKVRTAYDNGLVPILCVGEDEEVRGAGDAHEHVGAQLETALDGLPAERAAALVVAYEPVWAIGTGRSATPQDAQDVLAALRSRLAGRFGAPVADGIRLLYGGSMKAANAADLLAGPDVDGGLVGGASLDADDFCAIVRAAVPA